MGEVNDGLKVKSLQKGEIQLVTLSRPAEVVFYHPIVAWWYKVRHGFSGVCNTNMMVRSKSRSTVR